MNLIKASKLARYQLFMLCMPALGNSVRKKGLKLLKNDCVKTQPLERNNRLIKIPIYLKPFLTV